MAFELKDTAKIKTDENAGTASKLETAHSIAISGGATGTATLFDGSSDITIPVTSLDSSKLSGTVSVAHGGTGATTAAGALTNLGLTATATELNYVDGVTSAIQTQLNNKEPVITKNSAFNKNFGTSAGTVCEGNDSRLADERTPTSHASTHATGGTDAITPADIGAEPAFTKNSAFNKNFGTASGTICQGNDSRLTDARTPTAHVSTHKTGGTDALAPADIGAEPEFTKNSAFNKNFEGTASNIKVAGTASVGSLSTVARADHVHPAQTTVSGNAGSATKLATARTIGISGGATGTATSFNGTSNITIPVTELDESKLSSAVAIERGGTGATTASEALSNLGLTATAEELNYCDGVTSAIQTQIDGKENSFSKNTAFNKDFGTSSGTVCEGNDSRLSNSRTPTAHASTATTYGASSASNYGHAMASSTTPKAAGTAAVGSETAKFARGDHVHPAQTTVSGNAGTATKLATARTIGISGGVTGTATSFDGSANITIPVTSLDASKLSGVVPVECIPPAALERLIVVADDTARFKLTQDQVQLGDTVKVTSTNKMYFVIDVSKLSSEDGYSVYTAGAASSVPWSGVTGKPSSFTPSAHVSTHKTGGTDALAPSDIGAEPAFTKNSAFNKNFEGTASNIKVAGTAAVGSLSTVARADHVHPAQTTVSGNAGTATTLKTARTIGISGGATGTATSFNGSANITIPVTALDESKLSSAVAIARGGTGATTAAGALTNLGLTATATELNYCDGVTSAIQTQLNGKEASFTKNSAFNKNFEGTASNIKVAGTASVGSLSTVARADHVHPAQTTVSGNAGSATKLATARTIGISTGATGAATSFNGSANITIPVTSVSEAYLTWGGKSLAGDVTPIDMAMYNEFGANRLAFLPAASYVIEYSTDGGSTWTDYGASDSTKISLGTLSTSLYTGKTSSSSSTTCRLRITVIAGSVYTSLKKMMIYLSTNGVSGAKCLVEKSTIGSPDTYSTVGTYDVSGWSGWNSIPYSTSFGGSTSQTSQTKKIRFTFYYTSKSSSYPNAQLCVNSLRFFGNPLWTSPSTMASTGHMYTYDTSQNVTFPKNVAANSMSINGNDVSTLINGKEPSFSKNTAFNKNFGTASGTVCEGNDSRLSNSRTPTAHASTATTYGASSASNYGHAMASSTTPKAAGTAAVGSETAKFARGDHVHPAQTSVSGSSGSCTGNAATATKLATARTIDGVSFNGTAAITHYGTCSTAAGTAAKTVACTSYTLVTGSMILVKFTVANTAANPTLNVNSTGAKAMYYNGSAVSTTMLQANNVYPFVYDGTNYLLIGNYGWGN